MKRSKLHAALALATAMGGLGTGLFMQSAGAVNLSQQNIGDVLIFPYYNVRDGWQTNMHIVNTSDKTIALKLRFLEGSNSRDVLDFNVVMSPQDVFAGTIAANSTGIPVYQVGSKDTTCAVPAVPSAGWPFKSAAYTTPNSDGGPQDMERLKEGYVVVFVMGHAEATTAIAQNALHNPATGRPLNCGNVVNAFSKANIAGTASQFGEPINALKGSYTFINAARGVSAGGSAVALANFVAVSADDDKPQAARLCSATNMFFNPLTGLRNSAWNPRVVAADCPNLITAQEAYDFLEPSFADAYPNQAAIGNDNNPALSQIYGFPGGVVGGLGTYGSGYLAVSEVLRATHLINEWSSNPALGVTTQWVVNQPTKNFFVDSYRTTQGAWSPQRFPAGFVPPLVPPTAAAPLPPFSEAYSAQTPGTACTDVGITFYDREENKFEIQGGIVPSPSPRTAVALCFETNVIEFSSDNKLPIFTSKDSLDLTEDLSGALADGTLKTPFGWLDMKLDEAANAKAGVTPLLGGGLPAVGFMIRQRNFGPGNANLNFGDLVDHSYRGRGIFVQTPPTGTGG